LPCHACLAIRCVAWQHGKAAAPTERHNGLIDSSPFLQQIYHKRKLAAHSTISSARARSVDGISKAEHKVATPVNWKISEDVIIAGSVIDEDAPSNETFVPPI
jgi:hypothetical protein